MVFNAYIACSMRFRTYEPQFRLELLESDGALLRKAACSRDGVFSRDVLGGMSVMKWYGGDLYTRAKVCMCVSCSDNHHHHLSRPCLLQPAQPCTNTETLQMKRLRISLDTFASPSPSPSPSQTEGQSSKPRIRPSRSLSYPASRKTQRSRIARFIPP